ncbi:MAG: hypothetical protein WAL29_04485 [Bacteroidales bacterium]
MKIYPTVTILILASISISSILFFACNGKAVKAGMIVATEAPANNQGRHYVRGDFWRYIPETRIVAFIPGKPASAKVLTNEFHSACSPEISYDGKLMLFTAQQKRDDPWQIWEMDLESLKSRKITSSGENCTDPAYLPDGLLVFSKSTANDTVKNAHCLFTCNPDGSGLKQITFSPGTILATTVLRDGRLLTINLQTFTGGDPFLMVMRPDGTKADMFYGGDKGNTLISRPYETSQGRIVFIESDSRDGMAGRMISISYSRPLHSRIELTSGITGDFHSVLPYQPDKYLVSWRRTDSDKYALYEFDPVNKSVGPEILTDASYNVLDAVRVGENVRPKNLPSEVDMQVKTGLLFCQNINFPDPTRKDLSSARKAVKVEVLGIDTTYGEVRVMEDGSFYLKVMADIPFRIRTLDEKNNVISDPCSWLWLRPNERRGCIGCHEDPELVPENRVALAVTKDPVIIPVHITGIKEKIVELE